MSRRRTNARRELPWGLGGAIVGLIVVAPACAPEPELPVLADADALLRRWHLDLLGAPPSLALAAAIREDPSRLDAALDSILDDPRLGPRVRGLWAEVLGTRWDRFAIDGRSYGLDDAWAFDRSVGEEPLRLIQEVVDEDLPWTTIVTAPWTMADPLLLRAWPLAPEDVADADGWARARYIDGRPAAGIFATNAFHQRYTSTESNANRGRANQIARIALCDDLLDRPVPFERSIDLLDEGAVRDAVREEDACVGCHVALDPLAAYLHGFDHVDAGSPFEANRYHPERERAWIDATGVGPAYFGESGGDLQTLGERLAADPRFPTCAVEQAFTLLLRRPPATADLVALRDAREALLGSDLRVRAMLRSIVSSEPYRLAESGKTMTLDLFAAAVEDVTGYRWTEDERDPLAVDVDGLRTLGGGHHGAAEEAKQPRATTELVRDRLAGLAAHHSLTARPFWWSALESAEGAEVDFAVRTTSATLLEAILGKATDPRGEEATAMLTLWHELAHASVPEPQRRSALVAALLRDPDFERY